MFPGATAKQTARYVLTDWLESAFHSRDIGTRKTRRWEELAGRKLEAVNLSKYDLLLMYPP